MLYKLAGQMVNHLCSYQPEEDAESVLKNAGRQFGRIYMGANQTKYVDNTNGLYRAHNSGL